MYKSNSKKVEECRKILNISLISTSYDRLLVKICQKLENGKKFTIVTPNPAIIIQAQSNDRLKNAINKATFSVPDGGGLVVACEYLRLTRKNDIKSLPVKIIMLALAYIEALVNFDGLEKRNLSLIKGRVLFEKILEKLNDRHSKVFLLGGTDDSARKASVVLSEKYKNLTIDVCAGPVLDMRGLPVDIHGRKKERVIVEKIDNMQPDILFVGFGAPKQELWSGRWLSKLKIGGIMTVGGTFDFISGKTKMPPSWFPDKLEWFYRLLTKPGHFSRVYKSLIVFPTKLLLEQHKKEIPES